MGKKDKPIKVGPGRYEYRGYVIKSYGEYGTQKGVEWKAVNDNTGEIAFVDKSLHDIVKLIDKG
jgi:hypothetical protein